MKHALSLWSMALLLCAASAHAQLYKSVGPDGKITYSDSPPGPAAKLEKSLSTGSAVSTVGLPYEVAEATKNNPVTLYTTTSCAACDEGRKLLNTRGVPFTEKTVSSNSDIEQLHKAGGSNQLPFFIVGRNKQQGFDSGAWNSALTAASYPESNKLPKTYRNPQAESAAPAPAAASNPQDKSANNATPTADSRSDDVPPATGNAPPGFRF